MSWVKDEGAGEIIRKALIEDIGKGDITTSLLPQHGKNAVARALIIARESGIVCGINITARVFKSLDKSIKSTILVKDGERVRKGQVMAEIQGKVSTILTAERVALNFLSFLSGISTSTRAYVDKARPYGVRILDTRKTIPTLRRMEKYAVVIGRGINHRFRLDEMVLIKDNHLEACSLGKKGYSLDEIIQMARRKTKSKVRLEVEVKSMHEFKEALEAGPDIILLDNMPPADVRKAVRIKKKSAGKKVLLEASGNINLGNIRSYARSGVDFISLGTLTKDIKALDFSLELKPPHRKY
ncbi:MAG: carboxylating nicotinate-nucleotide diphosphorylase [Candidatus Omnitrophota bacterium]